MAQSQKKFSTTKRSEQGTHAVTVAVATGSQKKFSTAKRSEQGTHAVTVAVAAGSQNKISTAKKLEQGAYSQLYYNGSGSGNGSTLYLVGSPVGPRSKTGPQALKNFGSVPI